MGVVATGYDKERMMGNKYRKLTDAELEDKRETISKRLKVLHIMRFSSQANREAWETFDVMREIDDEAHSRGLKRRWT